MQPARGWEHDRFQGMVRGGGGGDPPPFGRVGGKGRMGRPPVGRNRRLSPSGGAGWSIPAYAIVEGERGWGSFHADPGVEGACSPP